MACLRSPGEFLAEAKFIPEASQFTFHVWIWSPLTSLFKKAVHPGEGAEGVAGGFREHRKLSYTRSDFCSSSSAVSQVFGKDLSCQLLFDPSFKGNVEY